MSKPVLFSVHELRFDAKRFNKDFDEPQQPINIWELFKTISKYKYSEYSYPLLDSTLISRIRIIELDEDKKIIKLLVIVSDLNARNRSYTDSKTGKTRLTNKGKTEGDDARVHITIKSNPDFLTGLLAIERERGSHINPNLLRVLLDRALEYIYENNKSNKDIINLFSEEHPSGFKEEDGTFTKLPKKIKCNLENIFSDEVLNAFKQGKINDLELIHTVQETTTDHHSTFKPKSSSFHFDVDPLIIPDEVVDSGEIQTTIMHELSGLWNKVFKSEQPLPLAEHKYRIRYENDAGKIVSFTYTPSESLDMTLAKTITVDPKTFTHIEWKEIPEINHSLCLRVFSKLKAL
ncbi:MULTISPECIES: hypothetical protein [Acinetobacter]|uniref:hypothetical protein n=1 Tax=Acinetobacter TaxID=469 RepID=UPI0013575948|nr:MULTISPECIES: hypothetical protein [Acinetobacter]MCO8091442.1 hypothetical protein [Acinetobacter pseudolwoffii]